jgi:hypothetical protein
MNKHSVLLSVGTALLLSTFCFDVSHAVHIDRTKQFPPTRTAGIMNEPATAPATQEARAPIPCRGDGMRRTGAPCTTPSRPGAGTTQETLYTIVAVTASVIVTLTFLLLSVSFFRRTPQPPFVRSTR